MAENDQRMYDLSEIYHEIRLYISRPGPYKAKYEAVLEQLGIPKDPFDIIFRTNYPPQKCAEAPSSRSLRSEGRKNQEPQKQRPMLGKNEASPAILREESYAGNTEAAGILPCSQAAPIDNLDEINRMISFRLKQTASFKKFETYLLELINSVGLHIPEVAYKLGVDKSYVYQILKGKKIPSRDKIIEIGILLHLTSAQVNDLLMRAGYTLYTMSTRDIIIEFCIDHKQSLTNTNLCLSEFGEKPL